MPGFVNVVVIPETVLAPGALPYSQYVNFDKTLGAVLLLAGSGFAPVRSIADCRVAAARAAPWMLATVLAVMLLSLAVGFVRFEPRWLPQFWAWAVVNLLTTCVSEEAFFCGFIQQESERALASAAGPAVAGAAAITFSAALFGLAHLAGGWRYALLAATAGSGYAVTYRTSRRLEMAIATHFFVIAMHFALFTYPALA
jgi:membrane protease YdiL (CAAX protease family)